MKGKELMVREQCQMGPVTQSDNNNQELVRWSHGAPRQGGIYPISIINLKNANILSNYL